MNRKTLKKIIRKEITKIEEGFATGNPQDTLNTKTRSEKVGYKMVGEDDKPTFDLSKESDRGDGEFPSGNLKTIKEWTEKDEADGTIKRWSKPLGDKYTEYEKKKFGLKEAGGEFDKIQIPATVKRWMNRFIDSVNSVKLERIKKMAILYKVIKSLGLNPQELNTYIQRIRRGLK
tara:strand:- start:2210 stop:2734 length:525 start_codon:yes stop_codon:yes gene_type:complete